MCWLQYLNDDDDDDKKSEKKAKEIGILEKTIASTLEQHQRRLDVKKDEVRRLKRKVSQFASIAYSLIWT